METDKLLRGSSCRREDDYSSEGSSSGSSLESSEEVKEKKRCCHFDAQSHPYLTVFIVFLAFAVDSIMVTVIDPILPDLLYQIDQHPNEFISQSFITKPIKTPANVTQEIERKNSVQIAVLVGLKPLLEVSLNIAVGFLVERVGHRGPMLIGCAFNMVATLGFGYLRNFYLLIITRVMQAIGGSLSVVGAMAFLAASFTEESMRLRATSIAFSGFTVGVTIGVVMGSVLYQYCGMQCPFLLIAALTVFDGLLRLCLLTPKEENNDREPTGKLRHAKPLLKDPQILAGLAMNFMQKFTMGWYVGTAPAWMLYTLNGQQWQIGVVMGCSSMVMVTSQFITGRLSSFRTLWIPSFLSLLIITIGLSLYPFSRSIWHVLIPDIIVNVGHGVLVAGLNPMLNHIVDIRHSSQYGIINGIYTSSYNLGLGSGPYVAGGLLQVASFNHIYWGLAVVMFLFSFIALSWRRIEAPRDRTHPQ